jgi:hypothetical protein
MANVLCIIAGQRAGTTALQSALGSTGRFRNFREIFHTEPPDPTGTFLEFARQRNLQVADMATDSQAQAIAVDYLDHLDGLAQNQLPLIDIKLNSLHVIKPFWSYVHQMPFFLEMLLRKKALFLLIRRRDVVEQVVSEGIARSVEKWHALEEKDIAGQLEISPALVASQARLILQGEALVLGCLERSDRLITVDYEDLYPEGLVNPKLLRALEEKLGVELPPSVRPNIKKNEPDKRRVVANYADIEKAVLEIAARYARPNSKHQITV